jgi:hypothetical protein
MPEWNWFAFHPYGVSKSMLEPAQKAVRERDLASWQKVYDLLSQTHTRPQMSHRTTSFSPNKYTIISNAHNVLVRDEIPDESSVHLRQALQAFIEHVSWLKLEGSFPRPRHWIGFEIDWSRFLKSNAERQEFEHFKDIIIVRKEKLPDPFWCLESNSAVDSNYITPEEAAEMAEFEADIGLFRRLIYRTDKKDESYALSRDMFSAMLFIQLAASMRLGIFFREDGT